MKLAVVGRLRPLRRRAGRRSTGTRTWQSYQTQRSCSDVDSLCRQAVEQGYGVSKGEGEGGREGQ